MSKHCIYLQSALLIVVAWQVSATAARGDEKQLQRARLGRTKPVHKFDGIFLAGQPSPADLKIAKQLGIRTVVNLRTAPELDFDEAKVVKSLGMTYYHLPFRAPSTLTDSIFDKARKILSDRKKSPLLLHCASANRVGAVWLVHRVLDDHVNFDIALREARKVGLRSPGYIEKARQYIARQKDGK